MVFVARGGLLICSSPRSSCVWAQPYFIASSAATTIGLAWQLTSLMMIGRRDGSNFVAAAWDGCGPMF